MSLTIKRRPNVVRGGNALPIGGNKFLMVGRKHEDGGIDIGNNPNTGIEVEDGEVVKTEKNGLTVFSAQPILGGSSPAELIMKGANPDRVFYAQEKYKRDNNLRDDGTTFWGGGFTPYTRNTAPIDPITAWNQLRKEANTNSGAAVTKTLFQLADPTGVTSWQAAKESWDRYKAGKESVGNLALNALGVIPALGKAKLIGKAVNGLSNTSKVVKAGAKAANVTGDVVDLTHLRAATPFLAGADDVARGANQISTGRKIFNKVKSISGGAIQGLGAGAMNGIGGSTTFTTAGAIGSIGLKGLGWGLRKFDKTRKIGNYVDKAAGVANSKWTAGGTLLIDGLGTYMNVKDRRRDDDFVTIGEYDGVLKRYGGKISSSTGELASEASIRKMFRKGGKAKDTKTQTTSPDPNKAPIYATKLKTVPYKTINGNHYLMSPQGTSFNAKERIKASNVPTRQIEVKPGSDNIHRYTLEDGIAAGANVIGSIVSHGINNRMIDSLEYRARPDALPTAKLNTEVNINPMIDKINDGVASQVRQINNNTASGRTAIQRITNAINDATAKKNQLFANKQNMETELINKDALNAQSVAHQNVTANNQWNAGRIDFENNRRQMSAENTQGLIQGIDSTLQDTIYRGEKRVNDLYNMELAMLSNPNAYRLVGMGSSNPYLRRTALRVSKNTKVA